VGSDWGRKKKRPYSGLKKKFVRTDKEQQEKSMKNLLREGADIPATTDGRDGLPAVDFRKKRG